MNEIIIKNCDVLVFNGKMPEFKLNQDIWVEGKRIKGIFPADLNQDWSGKEQIAAAGMLAVPGMINSHAHVPMVLFRGVAEDVTAEEWFNDFIFPMESNLTPEDVYWGALLGVAEMIESGITTVADHYFFMDQVAEAIQIGGMRGNLAWGVFEHEGEAKLNETVEFVKRWQGQADGRIKTWLGPHSPYLCGPEFLRNCAQLAAELDVGVHIHAAETNEQVESSLAQYHKTPIQVLLEAGILERPTILAHCLYPNEDDLKIMADHPAGVGQAPKTYLRLGFRVGNINRYLDHGIPLGLASDGAASSSTLNLFEQMRLMAMTQKSAQGDARKAPLDVILQIAFLGGAEVCREPELGELKPGHLADIVLLRQDRAASIPRLNPAANLVYSLGEADVDTVICDGRVLMRDRKLLTIDKAEVKREVENRLQRLVKIVPGKRVAVYPT
jgi:5-methylthioadenosine/S-adenosylhomocysteine deaminase